MVIMKSTAHTHTPNIHAYTKKQKKKNLEYVTNKNGVYYKKTFPQNEQKKKTNRKKITL